MDEKGSGENIPLSMEKHEKIKGLLADELEHVKTFPRRLKTYLILYPNKYKNILKDDFALKPDNKSQMLDILNEIKREVDFILKSSYFGDLDHFSKIKEEEIPELHKIKREYEAHKNLVDAIQLLEIEASKEAKKLKDQKKKGLLSDDENKKLISDNTLTNILNKFKLEKKEIGTRFGRLFNSYREADRVMGLKSLLKKTFDLQKKELKSISTISSNLISEFNDNNFVSGGTKDAASIIIENNISRDVTVLRNHLIKFSKLIGLEFKRTSPFLQSFLKKDLEFEQEMGVMINCLKKNADDNKILTSNLFRILNDIGLLSSKTKSFVLAKLNDYVGTHESDFHEGYLQNFEYERNVFETRLKNSLLIKSQQSQLVTGAYFKGNFIKKVKEKIDIMFEEFSIIYFDIDDFKIFNSEFDHDVGDEVIINLGKAASASIRTEDIIGHLGGDEFAIAIFGNSSDVDKVVVKKFLNLVDKLKVHKKDGKEYKTKVSLGVVHITKEIYDELQSRVEGVDILPHILTCADVVSHVTKMLGKNGACCLNPVVLDNYKNLLRDQIKDRVGINTGIKELGEFIYRKSKGDKEAGFTIESYFSITKEEIEAYEKETLEGRNDIKIALE